MEIRRKIACWVRISFWPAMPFGQCAMFPMVAMASPSRAQLAPILAVGPRSVGATQAFDAGADLYVQQPVTPERLLCNLADALVWRSEEVSAVA